MAEGGGRRLLDDHALGGYCSVAMISVERVSKYYGSHAAVADLSFDIGRGECVGFLGLNGAGKTTTLRLLSCLTLPTRGRVRIAGLDAETQPHEIRRSIGFLPDRPPLYPEMTVIDYVRYAGRLRQMSRREVDRRLPEVLASTGLEVVAEQVIGTLSHGYQQRVGIAQAIVHGPSLLVLDEPINGLDPVQIVEMRALIRRLRGEHTILLSTHILSEIEQTCDRILMLHEGRLAASGSEAEIRMRLGAEVTVEVTVAGGDPAALERVVCGVPGVSGCDVRGEGERSVKVLASHDVRADLARAVVGAGFDLLSLERADAGLEGVFLGLSAAREPETADFSRREETPT